MQYIQYYQSPLGIMLMSGSQTALTGLWFVNQRFYAVALPEEYCEKNLAVFDETKHWLDIYFSGKEPDFIPSIYMEGSSFRMEVWRLLLKIPYGTTTTYKKIAEIVAEKRGIAKMSAQAVGGAVGHNKISIIVPCHRVVGTDGSLTGYAGGIEKKRYLLTIEKAI